MNNDNVSKCQKCYHFYHPLSFRLENYLSFFLKKKREKINNTNTFNIKKNILIYYNFNEKIDIWRKEFLLYTYMT